MSLLLNQDNPQNNSNASSTGSSTVQQNNGIPVLPGSSSGVQGGATTSGGPQSTTQAPGAAPSSPWNNINSYISNNSQQAAQMGENVAQNIQNQYSNIGNEIAQTNQNFQNAVNAAYTPENTSLISEVATNPVAAASNPSNISAFQGQLNDTYTGPTDVTQYVSPTNTTGNTDWANINNAINQNAQTYATAANPASTTQLAEGLEGTQINPGVTSLDTILLNQNPTALSTIENAAGQWSNLNNLLSGTQTTDNTAVAQDEANAAAAQQAANAALNTGYTNLSNQVNTDETNAFTNAENQYNQELNTIQGYENTLNTPLQNYENATGVAVPTIPSLFTVPTFVPPTAAQEATTQDYNTQAALNELGGNTAGPLNLADASQAGTFSIPTPTVSVPNIYGSGTPTNAPLNLSTLADLLGIAATSATPGADISGRGNDLAAYWQLMDALAQDAPQYFIPNGTGNYELANPQE